MTVIATNQANGQSSAVSLKGSSEHTIYIDATTWDGATATIQAKNPVTGRWCSCHDGVTANRTVTIEINSGAEVRLDVAGGGGSESISANSAVQPD